MIEKFRQMPAVFKGPKLKVEPRILVIHAPVSSRDTAGYFASGGIKRKVSAHIAYSVKHEEYVQCSPFDIVCWHTCAKINKNNQRQSLNFYSLGIEVEVPYRDEWNDLQGAKLCEALKLLKILVPSLEYAIYHSDIDKGKKDPGTKLDYWWIVAAGYKMPYIYGTVGEFIEDLKQGGK